MIFSVVLLAPREKRLRLLKLKEPGLYAAVESVRKEHADVRTWKSGQFEQLVMQNDQYGKESGVEKQGTSNTRAVAVPTSRIFWVLTSSKITALKKSVNSLR